MIEILEAASGSSTILHLTGRINSANAPELGDRLAALLNRGCRAIVVDFQHVVHMTSAGFRSLLRADKQIGQAGGRLVLCGLHGLTLELFEIGGFLEMFNVAPSRDAALHHAGAAQP